MFTAFTLTLLASLALIAALFATSTVLIGRSRDDQPPRWGLIAPFWIVPTILFLLPLMPAAVASLDLWEKSLNLWEILKSAGPVLGTILFWVILLATIPLSFMGSWSIGKHIVVWCSRLVSDRPLQHLDIVERQSPILFNAACLLTGLVTTAAVLMLSLSGNASAMGTLLTVFSFVAICFILHLVGPVSLAGEIRARRINAVDHDNRTIEARRTSFDRYNEGSGKIMVIILGGAFLCATTAI